MQVRKNRRSKARERGQEERKDERIGREGSISQEGVTEGRRKEGPVRKEGEKEEGMNE